MDRDEIRKVCEAATPGPWRVPVPVNAVDATFIAGAREWVPALLAENEELRKALRATVKAHEAITARFRAGTPKPPPEWAFDAMRRARALLGENA